MRELWTPPRQPFSSSAGVVHKSEWSTCPFAPRRSVWMTKQLAQIHASFVPGHGVLEEAQD